MSEKIAARCDVCGRVGCGFHAMRGEVAAKVPWFRVKWDYNRYAGLAVYVRIGWWEHTFNG